MTQVPYYCGCPLWELYCCDYHAVRWPCPCPWGVNILRVLAGINGGLLTALQVDTIHRRPQSPWPPHIGTKQADCDVQCVWVGGAAASCWSYYCFVVFSSSLTGTVRLFCSRPMRINIWLCVSIVKVGLGDSDQVLLVLTKVI